MKFVDWNCGESVVRWWGVVWVILSTLLLLASPPAVQCQDYNAKGCPGGKEGSPPVEVTLACPSGQVIYLGEAVFGRNKFALCTITDGDCLDKTDAFEGCEGRHNCTVHFNRPFSPNCGYASFITVNYDCRKALTTPPPIVQFPSSTRGHVSTKTTVFTTVPNTVHHGEDDSGGKQSGTDNTGLIVGCVLAVIVTVILLIVAIIMVVRRLACGAELSDDEEKKSSSCQILPCVRTEANENSPKTRRDGMDGRGNDDDGRRNKRKRKHRGRRADKNQNMSPRLAPVGQEDEEEMSAPARKVVTRTAGGDVAVVTGDGSSSRSSVVIEATGGPVKRHSSGARMMCGDVTKQQGGWEGSELEDFIRGAGGGGGEAREVRRNPHTHQTGSRGPSPYSNQMGHANISTVDANRVKRDSLILAKKHDMHTRPEMQPEAAAMIPLEVNMARMQPSSARSQKTAMDRPTSMTSSSKKRYYDAVALPNTETFTSC